MKTTKIKNKIPEFKNIEEEALFWDTHSIADYMDELERVDNPFTTKDEGNGSLTLKFAPYVRKELENYARTYDTTPTTLIRLWVIDRLVETKNHGNYRARTA